MRVVIVGNAPVTRDHAALVDAADFAVRFNEPLTWEAGTGRRFDAWVIANGSGGRRFARRRLFADAPYRTLPREIWFPRAVEVHAELRTADDSSRLSERDERDIAQWIINANRLPQLVRRFDADFYRRCIDRLRALDPALEPTLIPSAGFMATLHARETWPEAETTLVGFTFRGWPAHPWPTEETFMRREEAAGRLRIVPA